MSDALVYNAGLVDPEATWPTEPGTIGRTAKQQFFRALGHCACDVHGGPTCATCRKRRREEREAATGLGYNVSDVWEVTLKDQINDGVVWVRGEALANRLREAAGMYFRDAWTPPRVRPENKNRYECRLLVMRYNGGLADSERVARAKAGLKAAGDDWPCTPVPYEEVESEAWPKAREAWAKDRVRQESFLAEYKAAKSDTERRFVMLKFYPRETLRMERSPQPRRRFLQEG